MTLNHHLMCNEVEGTELRKIAAGRVCVKSVAKGMLEYSAWEVNQSLAADLPFEGSGSILPRLACESGARTELQVCRRVVADL